MLSVIYNSQSHTVAQRQGKGQSPQELELNNSEECTFPWSTGFSLQLRSPWMPSTELNWVRKRWTWCVPCSQKAFTIHFTPEKVVVVTLENHVFLITSEFSTALCSVTDIAGPQRDVWFLHLSWRLNISTWSQREKFTRIFPQRDIEITDGVKSLCREIA